MMLMLTSHVDLFEFYEICSHGSDSVESAEREIALWFPNAEELCFYKKAITGWIYE